MAGWEDIDRAWRSVKPASGGGGYSPLPDGTIAKLVVVSQRPKVVGERETRCVEVVLEVFGHADESYNGRRIWHDFWITEKNLPYLKRDLTLLGWRGEKLSVLMSEKNVELVDLAAEAVLGVESYEDREGRERQKNVVRAFRRSVDPPSRGAGGGGAPPKAREQEDDDIPF